MNNRLINNLLSTYPYKDEFNKDLDSWQLAIETHVDSVNNTKELNIGGYKYRLKGSLNSYKITKVINETMSHVATISYTYGAIGREDNKEYKKIHYCKFVASFMYYFMLYLPFEPKEIHPDHDIRRLNALVARSIGLLIKQKNENSFHDLKANMEKKLYNEFIYSLVNNYFKTPEELYLFCRAFNSEEDTKEIVS